MEGWHSSGGSSKDEQISGGRTTFVTSMGGKTKELPVAPVIAAGSKRQRRPSVRLGEIGDLKAAASKGESLSTVRWISPNFLSRKTPSNSGRAGKLPRTRPLANVTHQGEGGPVLGIGNEDSNDVVVAPASADHDLSAAQDLEQGGEKAEEGAGVPSTSGRGHYGAAGGGYSNSRRGKAGQRRRPGTNRSTTNANNGVAASGRKAKELQDVGYTADTPPAPRVSIENVTEMPPDFTELSGTQDDIDLEDSGAARDDPGSRDRENNEDHHTENTDDDEHTQNGDTEVLGEDDGNRDDSSGRQEEVEPGGSREMRDNQLMDTNEDTEAAHLPTPKAVQRVLNTRLLGRGASMNGRIKATHGGVNGWLRSLGLEKYSELFEENEVDNDVLHLLTFEDLKEMGVMAVGARRKMFTAIQELGPTSLVGR